MYLNVKLTGEGMAYGGLPFPGTGCPVPYAVFNFLIDLYHMLELIGPP